MLKGSSDQDKESPRAPLSPKRGRCHSPTIQRASKLATIEAPNPDLEEFLKRCKEASHNYEWDIYYQEFGDYLKLFTAANGFLEKNQEIERIIAEVKESKKYSESAQLGKLTAEKKEFYHQLEAEISQESLTKQLYEKQMELKNELKNFLEIYSTIKLGESEEDVFKKEYLADKLKPFIRTLILLLQKANINVNSGQVKELRRHLLGHLGLPKTILEELTTSATSTARKMVAVANILSPRFSHRKENVSNSPKLPQKTTSRKSKWGNLLKGQSPIINLKITDTEEEKNPPSLPLIESKTIEASQPSFEMLLNDLFITSSETKGERMGFLKQIAELNELIKTIKDFNLKKIKQESENFKKLRDATNVVKSGIPLYIADLNNKLEKLRQLLTTIKTPLMEKLYPFLSTQEIDQEFPYSLSDNLTSEARVDLKTIFAINKRICELEQQTNHIAELEHAAVINNASTSLEEWENLQQTCQEWTKNLFMIEREFPQIEESLQSLQVKLVATNRVLDNEFTRRKLGYSGEFSEIKQELAHTVKEVNKTLIVYGELGGSQKTSLLEELQTIAKKIQGISLVDPAAPLLSNYESQLAEINRQREAIKGELRILYKKIRDLLRAICQEEKEKLVIHCAASDFDNRNPFKRDLQEQVARFERQKIFVIDKLYNELPTRSGTDLQKWARDWKTKFSEIKEQIKHCEHSFAKAFEHSKRMESHEHKLLITITQAISAEFTRIFLKHVDKAIKNFPDCQSELAEMKLNPSRELGKLPHTKIDRAIQVTDPRLPILKLIYDEMKDLTDSYLILNCEKKDYLSYLYQCAKNHLDKSSERFADNQPRFVRWIREHILNPLRTCMIKLTAICSKNKKDRRHSPGFFATATEQKIIPLLVDIKNEAKQLMKNNNN